MSVFRMPTYQFQVANRLVYEPVLVTNSMYAEREGNPR